VAVREADKEDSEGNVDEIKQYKDARWVTPVESLWRIYGFDLSERYLVVGTSSIGVPIINDKKERNTKT
jgi:hypothetical protein